MCFIVLQLLFYTTHSLGVSYTIFQVNKISDMPKIIHQTYNGLYVSSTSPPHGCALKTDTKVSQDECVAQVWLAETLSLNVRGQFPRHPKSYSFMSNDHVFVQCLCHLSKSFDGSKSWADVCLITSDNLG